METIAIEKVDSMKTHEEGYAPPGGWRQANDDDDTSGSEDDRGDEDTREAKTDIYSVKKQLQTAHLLRKAQRRFKEAIAKGASQSAAIEKMKKDEALAKGPSHSSRS